MSTKEDCRVAHRFCTNNKPQLLQSSKCGCFYCLEIFAPSEITEWISDSVETAICPYCSVDSVIADSADFPITKDFLIEMKKYWF